MAEEKMLRAYARTLLECGVALQKGQKMILQTPVAAAPFARLLAEEAYGLGAADIRVIWNDEKAARLRVDNASEEALGRFAEWKLERSMEFARENCCCLSLTSPDNSVMKGADPSRLMLMNRTSMAGMKPFRRLSSSNQIRWNVAAVPNPAWAKQIFPDLTEAEGVEKLWQELFACAYIEDPSSPAAGWRKHMAQLEGVRDRLNTMPLTGMHYRSSLGTDLRVGLVDDPVFVGGTCVSPDGTPFAPNIPTEEIFGVPHRDKAWGTMVSSMPLLYSGSLLEGIVLKYEDGRLTYAHADTGNDILQRLVESDEGARHLGECSMVPGSSAVGRAGHLFYTTLFDENAACHIAMGNGYSYGVGGGDRSAAAMQAKGLNESMIHVDVMIGTPDMTVTGILADGGEVTLFDGDFVI